MGWPDQTRFKVVMALTFCMVAVATTRSIALAEPTGGYYVSSLTFVQLNLATKVNTGRESQGDILSNIKEISGSAFGDTVIGNAGNERFFGNAGNVCVDGGLGSDTLVGAVAKIRLSSPSGNLAQLPPHSTSQMATLQFCRNNIEAVSLCLWQRRDDRNVGRGLDVEEFLAEF